MSVNLAQKGHVLEYTNTGSAISSGDIVIIGALIGVALTDIAATTGVGSVGVGEVYEVPCKAADTITQGMLLDWDASAGEFVAAIGTAASGDMEDGAIAWEDDRGALVNALLLRSGGTYKA